jgi:hypothetical protein
VIQKERFKTFAVTLNVRKKTFFIIYWQRAEQFGVIRLVKFVMRVVLKGEIVLRWF